MIGILFVCHGNICRSPMAEFVFKDMIAKSGWANEFLVASAATSTEEIGSDVHRGTHERLRRAGVPLARRAAVQLRKGDYQRYDYIIGMDSRNIVNINRILGNDPQSKVHRLLDFAARPRDIADPWYTGNFDLTYDDVVEGCAALLQAVCESGMESKGGRAFEN